MGSGTKGLETIFRTGSKKGVQPQHAPKFLRILDLLDNPPPPNAKLLAAAKALPAST